MLEERRHDIDFRPQTMDCACASFRLSICSQYSRTLWEQLGAGSSDGRRSGGFSSNAR